jgi:hypothetical protein
MFDGASPAVRAFGVPADPAHGGPYAWPPDGKLEAFAVAVLTHQPWEYLWSNVQGMIKYVDPDFGTGSMLEWPHDELITELHDPIVERDAAPALAAYYPNHPVVHHDIHALDSYARAAKVEGPLTAVFVVLMLAGFVLSRERRRIAAGLFGWTTTVMLVAPVALLFYGVRYATPAYGPLAAGAAIGLDELIAFTLPRVRGRWRFRTPRSKVPGSGDTR